MCDAGSGRQVGQVPARCGPGRLSSPPVSSALGFPSIACGFCHSRSVRPIAAEPP